MTTPKPTDAPRVEDSHAKLAAEMEAWLRSAPRVTTHVWDLVNSWAARVEALGHEERGRVEEKKAAVIEYAKALQAQIGEAPPQWSSALSNTLTLDLFGAVRALVESEKESGT